VLERVSGAAIVVGSQWHAEKTKNSAAFGRELGGTESALPRCAVQTVDVPAVRNRTKRSGRERPRLTSLRRALTERYLTVDGRSLALCRVVLATVLIVDLARRLRWLRDFYSNAGLLPNHTVLWRPTVPRLFSVFFMASHVEEAEVGFAIAFFCFLCLLVGWHTRLFHLLSFAMTTSLHNRILFAENWGAVTLGTLMIWTAFLPLGRRFSIDALLVSLRAGQDEQPDDVTAGRLPAPDARPAISLAALAVLLQLAAIYGFNFAHKSGVTWRDGSAIHYTLYQERIVTSLGVWTREHVPFAATRAMTYGTLAIEGAAPLLLLSPIGWRRTRALAVVLLTSLHVGIALMVNLGIFSAAILSYGPLLLDASVWDRLSRRGPRRVPRLLVFYDAGCGVCFQIVRVLARLDVRRRLTWISNRDTAARCADIDPALLDQTVVVVDSRSGRRWTRSDAAARILAALPLGSLCAWVLRVPGVRWTAGRVYDAFSRRRTAVSTCLGFAACRISEARGGVAKVGPRLPGDANARRDAPVCGALRRFATTLRELGVGIALLVLGADLSVSNSAIPRALRWESRPKWLEAAVMYPHVFEGWGMFAPDAPRSDFMVVVDAVTSDGRHVDPYNEVGSRVHVLPADDIPVRLGQDSMFCDYTLGIPRAGAYHQALEEWLLRYPERTGNPRDALESFEAFEIEHTSPMPGETHASHVLKRRFLAWSSHR
jgi:predicted DCC family thiol-disulfide oxidoreductase YuxK